MTESEIIVFGSFTENEARTLLKLTQKAEEKKESQAEVVFGSFDNLPELVGSENKPKPSDSSEIQKVGNGNHNGKSSNGEATASKPNGSTGDKASNTKRNVPDILIRDVLPRGLNNLGNLDFLNATLQALLYCSPFFQMLQGLRSRKISKVAYPTLASFMEFIGEFDVPEGANKKQDVDSLVAGGSFTPTMFGAVLRKFTPNISAKLPRRPRQEDAEEFLSFVMDQMHNELLTLNKGQSDTNGKSPSQVSSSEDEGWETIACKSKSAATRTQDFVPSELSSVFGGRLSSLVKATGIKNTATVQPFLLLHLDIWHGDIRSVEDALDLLCTTESTIGKDGVVTGSKSIKIRSLPKIMILHLMRFSYDRRGNTKLHKHVSFPTEMELSRDLFVPSSPVPESRKYQLVSTVTHHGPEVTKGNYTADVRYTNGQWLRFKDAAITAVSRKQVLQNQAYLLFYKQL